jgi:hypothetical protein
MGSNLSSRQGSKTKCVSRSFAYVTCAATEGLLISVAGSLSGSSAADEKSHASNNARSAAPTPNFNTIGAPDGEKDPSTVPAITSNRNDTGNQPYRIPSRQRDGIAAAVRL